MKPVSKRRLAFPLAAALALVPAAAWGDPPRGFGSLDVGGALASPLSGGGANRWYLGAVVEGGLELNDLLQVGARVRFFPGSVGDHENGLRWGLNASAGSASALARLTFELSDGLGLSAGLSVGYALFGDCYTNGTKSSSCGGTGVAAGLDVRLEWLARQHVGLHLSVEPQVVFRLEREATTLVPAAWLGVDW